MKTFESGHVAFWTRTETVDVTEVGGVRLDVTTVNDGPLRLVRAIHNPTVVEVTMEEKP